MGKVIIDAETRAKLNGLSELTQLCDESGAVIGYCLSPAALNALVGIPIELPFSEAELNEPIDLSNPGRPLEDILAELRRS
jgi:hypothetical protein